MHTNWPGLTWEAIKHKGDVRILRNSQLDNVNKIWNDGNACFVVFVCEFVWLRGQKTKIADHIWGICQLCFSICCEIILFWCLLLRIPSFLSRFLSFPQRTHARALILMDITMICPILYSVRFVSTVIISKRFWRRIIFYDFSLYSLRKWWSSRETSACILWHCVYVIKQYKKYLDWMVSCLSVCFIFFLLPTPFSIHLPTASNDQ